MYMYMYMYVAFWLFKLCSKLAPSLPSFQLYDQTANNVFIPGSIILSYMYINGQWVTIYNYMYIRAENAEVLVHVDNEEGSTIRLYKSIPYKMYGIMHNLHNIKTTQQILARQAPKEECEAYNSVPSMGIWCWKQKLFLDFRVYSQHKCTLTHLVLYCEAGNAFLLQGPASAGLCAD